MGKQGSKQGDISSPFASFQYQFRYQKMVQGSDPIMGRKLELLHGLRSNSMKFGSFKGAYVGKRHTWIRKHFSSIVFTVALMGFLFLLDSLMGSIFEPSVLESSPTPAKLSSETVCVYVFFSVFYTRKINTWKGMALCAHLHYLS